MSSDLNYIHIQALKWLRSHHEPLNARFFANNLSISSKTIRNDLSELDTLISNHGAHIVSKAGVGYSLVVDDDIRFDNYCDAQFNDYATKQHFSVNFERAHYIVRYLLAADDYTRIEDIEDQLFVNRTTVVARLRVAKDILAQFDLKVINRSKHGLKVSGSEHNIRSCINHEYYFYQIRSINVRDEEKYGALFVLNHQLFSRMKNLIISYQNAYSQNNLSDQSIDIIVRAIYIAYLRSTAGHKMEFDIKTRQRFSSRNSYYLAKILLDKAAGLLNWEFSIDDIIEIAIYIVGYRVLFDFQSITYSDEYLRTRNLALELVEYLERINGFQYIGKDVRLCDDISLHLVQILIRNEYNLLTCNYLNQHKCSLMADKLAIQAAYFLYKKLGIMLAKDEVYRLSLLIYPIFGRYPFQFRKIKALLVPEINKSVGYGMAERLMRNYSTLIASIDVREYYELKDIDLNEYQLLFTSLRSDNFDFIGNRMKIIYTNMFFDEDDKVNIRQQLCSMVMQNRFDYYGIFSRRNVRYNLGWRSREQALRQLTAVIESSEMIGPGLLDDLRLAEQIYPANSYENTVFISPVMPHTKKATIYVFVLKKPINWNFKKAQIIVFWDRGRDKEQAISFENESVPHIVYLVFRDRNVVNLLRNGDDPKKIVQVYRAINDMVLANGRSFK